jgi:hypothetical protein
LDALNEMSGTSRLPSVGTPVPLCHEGFEKIVLAPPPVADKPDMSESFQAFSGMYCSAEAPLVNVLDPFQ